MLAIATNIPVRLKTGFVVRGHILLLLLLAIFQLLTNKQKRAWVLFTYNTMMINLINPLQSFGFNLMATSNYHWLLSFSRAEQVLLSNIDEDGGCRRKCYRVVRQLKEDVWCPGSKPVITAYHLQVPAQAKQPSTPFLTLLFFFLFETYCLYTNSGFPTFPLSLHHLDTAFLDMWEVPLHQGLERLQRMCITAGAKAT